jgi:hypothetical protein
MRTLCSCVLVPAIVCFAGSTAWAATQLSATLSNAAETTSVVPTLTTGQPRPVSFGTATFELNDAQTAMTMMVQVFNIDFTGSQTPDTNDNLTNAHIHASATVTPTTTAGVVWGFIGTPFNDNNPNNVLVTPFATGVGGTVTAKWDAEEGNNTTLTAQLSNLLSQHAYINFHTSQFGGGEIRGTLVVVPEAASLGVLAMGAVALLARRRRGAAH